MDPLRAGHPTITRSAEKRDVLLCCHFIALLTQAFIERQIRATMAAAGTDVIPLYPEHRDCAAPSASRVLEIFNGVARHHLTDKTGHTVQVFEPALTPLQQQILNLLDIQPTVYSAS